MELYPTDGNVIPPNAIVSIALTRDRLKLRVARWSSPDPRGTILVAMGRSEFIEEYAEVVALLLERRFDVVVFDWRGQGRSDREIRQGRRGYVSNFRAFRTDLEAIEQQILIPFAPKPWFGLGHSMGAAVLLDQAHDKVSPFERLVLSAPMIDLPVPRSSRRAVRLLSLIGAGRLLIPGGAETSILVRRSFADNILTGDARQFERLATANRQLPDLSVGSPTFRWTAGAFALMRKFAVPLYPIETLMPILIVAAGDDRIVDTSATERFALRLKSGRCITLPGARHQVIMEQSEITAQFWAAFDAFIPGFEAQRTQNAA